MLIIVKIVVDKIPNKTPIWTFFKAFSCILNPSNMGNITGSHVKEANNIDIPLKKSIFDVKAFPKLFQFG